MHGETISFRDAVRLGQQAWQEKRATGFARLTRKHQIIDLPLNVTSALQRSVVDHLPIPVSIKHQVANEHPPLLMGWSTGIDDRDRKEIYRPTIPVEMHLEIPDIPVDDTIFVNGVLWLNEAVTGKTTQRVIQNLKCMPHSTTERLLRRYAYKPYGETGATFPRPVAPFLELLDKPVIRDELMAAWFSGDTAWASDITQHETGRDIYAWTHTAGLPNRYAQSRSDGGTYALAHGVAHVSDRFIWLPTLTMLTCTIGGALTKNPDIITAIPSLGLFLVSIKLFKDSARAAVTHFMHEITHYLGEGEGHIGWYPMTLHRYDSAPGPD